VWSSHPARDLSGLAELFVLGSLRKPDIENFDSGIGRIDQVIGKNDRVTGRYEYDWFTKAFF
jgi:hypothetical protein